MNNLAFAYKSYDQLASALPMLEAVLAKRKSVLGADHPDTLLSSHNLAGALQQSGQGAKAAALLEESLEKSKAKLGADHPITLHLMNNLATAYLATGQLAKALPLFQETLAKRKTNLGPDHPDTLTSMGFLGSAYKAAGQLAKAVPLLEETLAQQNSSLGPDHPSTLVGLNNLAAAYEASGQLAKAIPLHEEFLRRSKAKFGPDHKTTRIAMANLGKVYVEAREGEKAATTLAALVETMRRHSPVGSPTFAGLLAQVSTDLMECGQHAAAEPLLRECLAIREKNEPDDSTIFSTQAMLGAALIGQKKYAEAEPLLLSGYEGMKAREKSIPPVAGSRILESLDLLVELYTATRKPDEAKKFRELRAKCSETKPADKNSKALPR
jgi:tetratricopeptide (TPR) repeat protein